MSPDRRRRRRARLGAGALALALAPAVSAAAQPVRIFRLPAEPLERALVRFAVQGAVSVGGDPAGCGATSRPVLGVMRPAEALQRLLPPSCRFRSVDARSFLIVGTAPATGAHPPPARSTADVVDIDELVVTAEKRTEPLLGSPFAVSALSGSEAVRLGAKSFVDLASQLVSVTETNLGPGRDKIFIRGLSDGAFTGKTQSTVGLYLDDVPITYNAPDPDLRLVDVDRVEVLRGPQGSLYGSGSIGGIVRIVTARPDPNALYGSVSLDGGLDAHDGRSYGVSGVLNAPLAGGAAAVRVAAYDDQLGGYLANPVLGREAVNRGSRWGVRVKGLVPLAQDLRLQAVYAHQTIDMQDSQYVQDAGAGLVRRVPIREPQDSDFTLAGLKLTRSGSLADLRVSAAYIDHDLSTLYDATGAFPAEQGRPATFDDRQRSDLWVTEAVATSVGEGRLRWLAGAFAAYASEKDSARLEDRSPGGGVTSVYARHDRLAEAAAFGEVSYQFTERLSATLGGRAFVTRVTADSGAFGLAQPAVAAVDDERVVDSGFAPKVRISYAFAPDVVLYGQIQEGYRAGGYNTPGAIDGVPGGPDVREFRPDHLWNYELGGEAPLFHRRLVLRAAVFHARWSDVQSDQFRNSGLPVTVNIGDGTNTGVEVEAQWRPMAGLDVRGSVLFDDPGLTRTTDVFPARVDVGLPGVSGLTGSAVVTYRWTPAAGLTAEVSAQGSYVGRSYLTFDGGAASAMGHYALGRVSAALTDGRWRAQAYVDNVADVRGDTFAFGNPFSRMRTTQETPVRPRRFGLALTRSF